MNNNIPFRVVKGLDEIIMSDKHPIQEGSVYFATDTKKIYLDTINSRLSMGGNTGIYYGKADFEGLEGPEFFFKFDDIDGENLPNINDLIINSDGCFYKVLEKQEDQFKTERLTIAGSGGGGGTQPTLGSIKLNVEGGTYRTVLSGQPFAIQFTLTATDADGANSGPGRYEIKINNVVKKTGVAENSALLEEPILNTVELGELFTLTGDYTVQVVCYAYTGGAAEASVSKRIYVNSTDFKLTWNYDDTTINSINNDFTISWGVSVNSDDRKSVVVIDDTYTIDNIVGNSLTIPQNQLEDYGLTHGAHKFQLQAYATIGTDPEPKGSNSIIKNVIFYDSTKSNYIVACDFFNKEVQQYSTIQLPVMIYHANNTNGTATIDFKVNSGLKGSLNNCKNLTKYNFSYTPENDGFVQLQFVCGGTTLDITLDVQSLQLSISEVDGYEFKFKATDFTNNEEIKNWKCKNQKITFSENFDWINGGLKTGIDDVGPYFKIQAGSYMTIPYKIFETDLKDTGACFKIIFKASNCRDYDANILTNYNGDVGLVLNAQNGLVQAGSVGLDVAHCEDTYIEYEFDVCKYSEALEDQYLTTWVDGVPASVVAYSSAANFQQTNAQTLKIGSNDCDVHIYLIKFYKKHLTSREHLNNFIIDAPNGTEIKSRHDRNNIFAKDHANKEYISPTLLADQNKKCNVYTYTIPYMPTSKEDVYIIDTAGNKNYNCCSFAYYKGSDQAIREYSGVKMRAQGTSSMSYGISAYNIDTKFPEKWEMDDEAIPVNYFNTKVNVASCEGANNAINQEWYNKYQPYKTQKRILNKNARDTMEFKPGVLFLQDNNTEDSLATATQNNIFKECDGYADLSTDKKYPRMYSICNMGNSKKNTEVFHIGDLARYPYECCVEVADNNTPAQQMIQVSGYDEESKTEVALNLPDNLFDEDGFVIQNADWGTTTFVGTDGKQYTKDNQGLWKNALIGEKYFEFRYAPEDVEETVIQDLSNRFLRLIRWFAKWNPANTLSEEDITENLENILYSSKYNSLLIEKYSDIFKIDAVGEIENILINEHEFSEEEINNTKQKAINKVKEQFEDLEESSDEFNKKVNLYYYTELLNDFNEQITDEKAQEILQTIEATYKDIIKTEISNIMKLEMENAQYINIDNTSNDTIIISYSNYIRETKYTLQHSKRFSKADLTIPSITTIYSNYNREDEILSGRAEPTLYERDFKYDSKEYRAAQMLSEAGKYLIMDSIVYHYLFIERHTMVDNVAKNTFWNTEDGIHWDLTKDYDNDTADGTNNNGYLAFSYGQEIEHETEIFNANQSAWLNFIRELPTLREDMYKALYKNKDGAWSAEAYLNAFSKEWQDVIPEACWIEDFNRKYFRPRNVYGDEDYLVRLANGKKTHQRKQYEVYQEQYMDSKYKANVGYGTSIQWRSKQDENQDKETNGKYKIGCKFTLYADGYFTAAIASGSNVNKHIRAKKGETIEFQIEQATHFNDATCYLYSPNLYSAITEIEGLYPGNFNASAAGKLRELTMVPKKGTQSIVLGSSQLTDASNKPTGKYLSFANNIEKIVFKDCQSAKFEMDLKNCQRLKELDTFGSAFTAYVIADGAPLNIFKVQEPSALVMSNLYYLDKNNFSIASYSKLNNISIDNIDYNINSNITKNISKTIVQKALEKNDITYFLNNVGWKFDSTDDQITDTNIPLLDRLLIQTPKNNQKIENSLTGQGIITAKAYNNINSLPLYEKYGLASVNDTTYPNFILNFEGEQSKLYTIDIKDGDGKIVWTRQVKSFDNITNELLSNSALGSFDAAAAIKKSESNESVYQFANKWRYTTSSGQTGEINADSQGDYYYLDLSKINNFNEENITVEPMYNSTTRYYTVRFCDNDENELYSIQATYRTPFNDIKPPVIPTKDDSSLPLTQTYYLKGYSAINGANTIINENTWQVTADVTLYTVFNEINVYKLDYTPYLNIVGDTLNGLKKNNNGDYIYQGKKIVIPNNIVTIAPQAFGLYTAGDIDNRTNLTHVFVANNNILTTVSDRAFAESKLEYFEFTNSIQTINQYAFRSCNLQSINYSNTLILPRSLNIVGNQALNSAFGSLKQNQELTIIVPANVTSMGQFAIAHLGSVKANIYIGSNTEFSNLTLNNINNIPTISSNGDGTYDICNIYFYTNKYTAQSEIDNKSIREFFDDILLEKPGNINVSYINQLGGEQ